MWIRGWAPTVALCVLAGTSPAVASQTYPGPPSVGDLTRRADVVVIGEVASVAGVWDPDRRTIQTRIELTVAETLKGAPVPALAFTQPGGQVGDHIITVAGVATFAIGERVLVFLEGADDGSLRLADPQHGKLDRGSLDRARAEIRRTLGGSGS